MSDSANAASSGVPVPGPEHALLKPFEGTFRSVVRLWMGPGEPMVHTGTMVNSFQVGGLYLQQEYTGDPNDGPFPSFVGRGFWGYNTASGEFEGFWIDNASTMMQMERGTADAEGKVWTMTSTVPNPQTGEMMTKKSVIELIDKDHHSMDVFFTTPDGREVKGMEIQYERQS